MEIISSDRIVGKDYFIAITNDIYGMCIMHPTKSSTFLPNTSHTEFLLLQADEKTSALFGGPLVLFFAKVILMNVAPQSIDDKHRSAQSYFILSFH